MSPPLKVIGIAGYKNAGKTTLVTGLVGELTRRGYVVSTVKHAHHAFDIDHPGRDSFRHREAGAREVAVVSRTRWALIHELNGEDEPSLDDILARLTPCDLVVVEGYRSGRHDKIEVRGKGLDHRELWPEDQSVIAIASAEPLDADIPVFGRGDVAQIADFIEQRLALEGAT